MLPTFWTSSGVDHSDYLHPSGIKQVKDFEREPANKRAPGVPIYLGLAQRILLNLAQEGPNLGEELITQALLALFIPIELLGQISFRLRPDDKPIAHFLREVMRAYTSAQGEPPFGSCSRARSLSSISLLSSLVNCNASGASAMLFQISSTNCRRSSTGSSNTSAAENLLMKFSLAAGSGEFKLAMLAQQTISLLSTRSAVRETELTQNLYCFKLSAFRGRVRMKALLAILAIYSVGVAAHSQSNTNAAPLFTWKARPPLSGCYMPEGPGLLAGEILDIKSNRFRYTWFTDSIPFHAPDYTGNIIEFSDHIFFDHCKIPSPDRVSGLLDDRPVLWTYEAFNNWKRTGKIDPTGILYWNQPETKRDPLTNRIEMVRQLRQAMRIN